MSSNSTTDNLCASDDTICVITKHEKAVIVVPTLFLAIFVVTLVVLCVLRYCCHNKRRVPAARSTTSLLHHQQRSTRRHQRDLQGIDAPSAFNILEHEAVPMTIQTTQQNVRLTRAAVPQRVSERQHGAFSQVTPLPRAFSVNSDNNITLCRARMDNRDVILRILKELANHSERQYFLGFAWFLSELGPHPQLPAVIGVVSVRSPLVMVIEELHHGDLLGYLWKCRHVRPESAFHLTEKGIFTLAGQVASALQYLHSQNCIHGNVGARSVLVGRDLTAKLWGLGPAYRKRTQAGSPGELEDMELRKWQAPEVLASTAVGQNSDVWSFGILLYEMVTLGDPPFAEIMATELLQYLQRGRALKKPANCSNALYSVIKSCCQWSPRQRLSVAELIRKLHSGEKRANDSLVLQAASPLDIGKYMREAGYGEAYNYAVL